MRESEPSADADAGAHLHTGVKTGVRMDATPYMPPPALAVRVKGPAGAVTPHGAGSVKGTDYGMGPGRGPHSHSHSQQQPTKRERKSLGERVEEIEHFLSTLDMTMTEGMRRSTAIRRI